MPKELILNFGTTSFVGLKKKKNEQKCNSCFCWKPKELFNDASDTCKDCE